MKVEIGPRWGKIDKAWVTVGISPSLLIDHVADWSVGLPFDDESVSLLYASHVLEHIWWFKTVDALKEAYRVLKSGGVTEIHVPDLRKILFAYVSRECGDDWRMFNEESHYMRWVNGRIFAYGEPDNRHRAIFDRDYLWKCLMDAGFKDIRDGAPVRGASKHPEIDLAVTAVK